MPAPKAAPTLPSQLYNSTGVLVTFTNALVNTPTQKHIGFACTNNGWKHFILTHDIKTITKRKCNTFLARTIQMRSAVFVEINVV
jgi:hypothetical protein